MKKTIKAITKAQEVVKAEKLAMQTTIDNVTESIVTYVNQVSEIDAEILALEILKQETNESLNEAVDYKNKLAHIIGE